MSKRLTLEKAQQILVDAAAAFYRLGWMVGTSGNLSLRLSPVNGPDAPLQYLITASGVDKGALTSAELLLLGVGATPLAPSDYRSSAETMLHEAIYQGIPSAQAVYHVHTVSATVLSMQVPAGEALVFQDQEMLKGLGCDTHETTVALPVLPNTQDIAGLAQTLMHHLNPAVPGFLLQGHGLYAWGATPFEAQRHLEIWEFLFQCRLAALSIGASLPPSVPGRISPATRPGS